MTDKVFIVFYCERNDHNNHFIESVWSTKELAQAAIHYHANKSNEQLRNYSIIEREINKTING
jgi:hypothetical protein